MEAALSIMVDNIKSTIRQGQYPLGVFLDIEGAFDNLSSQAIASGMNSHCFPTYISKWLKKYLDNCTVTA